MSGSVSSSRASTISLYCLRRRFLTTALLSNFTPIKNTDRTPIPSFEIKRNPQYRSCVLRPLFITRSISAFFLSVLFFIMNVIHNKKGLYPFLSRTCLYCKSLASFCAPALQYRTTCCRAHTRPKAVLSCALTLLWLVCALWHMLNVGKRYHLGVFMSRMSLSY